MTRDAIEHAGEIIPKPVVPQYVADWYEEEAGFGWVFDCEGVDVDE